MDKHISDTFNGTFAPQFLYSISGAEYIPCSDSSVITLRALAENTPGGATRLSVIWKNTSGKSVDCRLEIRIKTDFKYTHFLIPAVMYNGNAWGKGGEPKGLTRDGSPWIFDCRRTSIPSCTISENPERFFAMFASAESAAALDSSCSMIPCDDGTMIHRILYPGFEEPVTYSNRDSYSEPHGKYIRLQPGEPFETHCYIMQGIPGKKFFAAAEVEDAAIDLAPGDFAPAYEPEELKKLCFEFVKKLIVDAGDRKLICTGMLPDKNGGFAHRVDFEFGWCGQNGMYARELALFGFETGDRSLTETAMNILDFWASGKCRSDLIYVRYDGGLKPSPVADTCNLAYAVSEYAKVWDLFSRHGIDKPEWLAVSEGIADFMISHFDDECGFGKTWDAESGKLIDSSGTIGAFMIPALCDLYSVTGKSDYLNYAKKACRLYCERDLSKFMCTAGALDTYCIDKETSGPILMGSIALYELDGDKEWLEYAGMAGYYFCSWMFHHDIPPVRGSDFEKYSYRTLGGTSVSTQHHHLDPWGAFAVPGLLKLCRHTGDLRWKKRAGLIWANAVQNIAPLEGKIIHGRERFAGAQNEAYFHCSWGGENAPGAMNDWLVSWPQAFIWNTAIYLIDKDSALT